jgi:hypothetical protein
MILVIKGRDILKNIDVEERRVFKYYERSFKGCD